MPDLSSTADDTDGIFILLKSPEETRKAVSLITADIITRVIAVTHKLRIKQTSDGFFICLENTRANEHIAKYLHRNGVLFDFAKAV